MKGMKGKQKANQKEPADDKKFSLRFPDFTTLNVSELCPKYVSVLGQKEEWINMNDTETLQIELESLLVSVTKRKYLLEDEIQMPVNKVSRSKESENSGKRSHPPDGKLSKKFKDNNNKAHFSNNTSRSKKNNQEKVEVPKLEIAKAQKSESTNRFWSFMEPYYAEITQDDIKMIEDWIKTDEDNSEDQKIPLLGKHFSHKWLQEDIEEEKNEGLKTDDRENRKKGSGNNLSLNTLDKKLLEKAEKEFDTEESTLGPLTQRIVSCLIDQNLMTSLEDTMTDTGKDIADISIPSSSTKGNFVKSLNIGNTSKLEKRIQKELIQIGFLEAKDVESENEDDEILSELKKLQSQLKSVVDYNNSKKKQLLDLAKEEISRQEIKRKLQAVDAQIMEAQREIAFSKIKKEGLTREQEQALKSLKQQALKSVKEREKLVKLLRNFKYPC